MNIYLKTAIIIPNSDLENELVSNIHPPIDRILLSALIKENLLSKNLFKPWTILEAEDYNEIINEIKGKFKPLWKVEYLWNLEKNEE